MCGLFGSFNKEKFLELAELNAYRGTTSSSIAHFSEGGGIVELHRSRLMINPDNVREAYFKVGHVQAPTTEQHGDESTIHPASANDKYMLWHNGIIKDFEVKRLQEKYQTAETWDTMLLLRELDDCETWLDNLSELNGSFACVFYEEYGVYLFRNEISPIFIDGDLNFSSVKFPGSESLAPNIVFEVNFKIKSIDEIGTFKTKENPYFFQKDLL